MFSPDMKHMIAEKVQKILQDTCHPELPKGEINFLLHVDGAESWSWANIRNNGSSIASRATYSILDQNMFVKG